MTKLIFVLLSTLLFLPLVTSCGGCFYQDRCYLIGEVENIGGSKMFCDFSHDFSPSKDVNESCMNDFECTDGLSCMGGQCASMEDYQAVDSEYESLEIFNSFCSFSDEDEFCLNYTVLDSTILSAKNCSFDDSYDSSFKCYKCNSGFKWDGEECINRSIEIERCSKNTFLTSNEFLTGFSCNLSSSVFVSFNLDGIPYYLRLKDIGNSNSEFTLTKKGATSSSSFFVNYGKETKIDINSDGTYDIILGVNKLNTNKIEFSIKRTYEIIPSTITHTCNGFSYSSWSECNSDGIQTRRITARIPAGCTGGTSESLTRDCSPPNNNNNGFLLLILLGVVIFLIIVVAVLYFLIKGSEDSNSGWNSKNVQ